VDPGVQAYIDAISPQYDDEFRGLIRAALEP
jgi:hypothetical protein